MNITNPTLYSYTSQGGERLRFCLSSAAQNVMFDTTYSRNGLSNPMVDLCSRVQKRDTQAVQNTQAAKETKMNILDNITNR